MNKRVTFTPKQELMAAQNRMRRFENKRSGDVIIPREDKYKDSTTSRGPSTSLTNAKKNELSEKRSFISSKEPKVLKKILFNTVYWKKKKNLRKNRYKY